MTNPTIARTVAVAFYRTLTAGKNAEEIASFDQSFKAELYIHEWIKNTELPYYEQVMASLEVAAGQRESILGTGIKTIQRDEAEEARHRQEEIESYKDDVYESWYRGR